MIDFSFLEIEGGQTAQEGSALAARPSGALGETGVSAGSGGIQITVGGFVVGAVIGGVLVWGYKEGWFK